MSDRTAGDRAEAGAPAESDPGAGRARLEARYRALVRERLPAAARAGGWVLWEHHCLGRVLLDDAVQDCWYDVLDRRRTAFVQLDDLRLAGAVALGSACWRGRRPAPAGARCPLPRVARQAPEAALTARRRPPSVRAVSPAARRG